MRASLRTALALVFALSGCSFVEPVRSRSDAPNGITETYAVGQYNAAYAGSVVVTLPARPANASWFCNWIMLVDGRETDASPPFVQIGEIRWLHAAEYPSAFVAYQKPREKLIYIDLGRISDTEHTVAIAGDATSMRLSIDGRVVKTYARSQFFHRGDRAYYQFASEVKAPGDEPTGYLRDVRVKSDSDAAMRPLRPACVRHDRGLDLRVFGDRYEPFGSFDPSVASGFRHCESIAGWQKTGLQT